MSGKVKVMGDLSKALKLEEVLRAAREADEKKAAKNAWKLSSKKMFFETSQSLNNVSNN